MSQQKEMTLEQAKKEFPLNLHWVDCREDPSCNEFPLKPLCPCYGIVTGKLFLGLF